MSDNILRAKPLTQDAFAPFGDVIEVEGVDPIKINLGHAERYHNLSAIDCSSEGGQGVISLVQAKPWKFPLRIEFMERHPISSQAFVPLAGAAFLLVVADKHLVPRHEDIRVFLSNGRQGVNYHRGTWHHPLLAMIKGAFLVID